MVKFKDIPLVEIVEELESRLDSDSEQKEQNQEYILSNLDKYIVDFHGNFSHTDKKMIMSGDEKFYIRKKEVKDHNEIKERIVEMIINEKDGWEIDGEGNYKRKNYSKRIIMFSNGFSPEQNEAIKKVLEEENGSRVTQQQQEFFMRARGIMITPNLPLFSSEYHHHTQWISNHDRIITNHTTVPDSLLIDEDRSITQQQQSALIHNAPSRYDPEILPLD